MSVIKQQIPFVFSLYCYHFEILFLSNKQKKKQQIKRRLQFTFITFFINSRIMILVSKIVIDSKIALIKF